MKWMQWITSWFGGTKKSSLGIGIRAALSGGAPGGWASDHREETAHNTGFNYIAIHAIASQVAGSSVTVFADGDRQFERHSRRKCLAAHAGSFARWKSIYGADDRETDPLPPDHPLVRLLKRPNPHESGADFRYRQAQQMRLTGTCLVWNVPSIAGRTCERYVIPTAMASPVAPTAELPHGGWRISPIASRYTPVVDDTYVDCPSWYRILGQILDARQVQVIRFPHAWYLDDGQSPLSAGAKWVDAGEAVDEARYHQLKNGIDPSLVWNLPPDVSPDQDEIDRVQAKISAKYGGPENVGRVMVAQSGTSITTLSATPRDMCYTDGFQDFKAALLALHQTPPVAVGLQEPGAYAAYNASMKAWRHSAIQPLCDMLAESDTEYLAPQFGAGLTIEIESAAVDDAELLEQQLQNDLAAKVRTKNEWRAVRGMKPLPGSQGDELVGSEKTNSASEADSQKRPSNPSQVDHGPTHAANRSTADSSSRSGTQSVSNDIDENASQLDFGIPSGKALQAKSGEDNVPGDNPRELSDSDSTSTDDTVIRVKLISEILFGLMGSSILDPHAAATESKTNFNPSQLRDAFGRWARSGSPEEIRTLKELVANLLKGNHPGKLSDFLTKKLTMLSTEELRSIHREIGIELPPESRSHLLSSVIARLDHVPRYAGRNFPIRRRSGKVDVYVHDESEVHRRLVACGIKQRERLTRSQWGQLVGAQPDACVHVFPEHSSRIAIVVDHPDYRCRRIICSNGLIENIIFQVSPKLQRQGIATRVFTQQVETASKLGFKTIRTGAAGSGTAIRHLEPYWGPPLVGFPSGYYTWPRLGFDAKVASLMRTRAQSPHKELREVAADFKTKFPNVEYLSDLMQTEDGRTWWKQFGGDLEVEFDLKKPSISWQILGDYCASLSDGKESKALIANEQVLSGGTDDSDSDQPHGGSGFEGGAPNQRFAGVPVCENPDELTEEQNRTLDRIWDRFGQRQFTLE